MKRPYQLVRITLLCLMATPALAGGILDAWGSEGCPTGDCADFGAYPSDAYMGYAGCGDGVCADGGWGQAPVMSGAVGHGALRGFGSRLLGRLRPGCGVPCGPAGCGPGDVWANGGGGYMNLGGTCCGPHWWDFFGEAVFLKRDSGDNRVLMSQGIRGFAAPEAVSVLSTNDAQFNYEPAFRVGGRFQMSAVSSIEGIYLGGLDWDDRIVRTTANNDFYSAFSDFGNLPFGGFEDSDQAASTSLTYDAELDSVEINWRRDYPSRTSRASTSLLAGVRYVRLDESLGHRIDVAPHFDPINNVNRVDEFTQYDIATENDLVGFQFGGEFVRCLSPGIIIGGEAKTGVFGNNAEMRSNLVSTTLPGGLVESETDAGLAYMSHGKVFLLWQVHPLWKLRTGYELMFFEGVATAEGNYNSTPFINTTPGGGVVATPTRPVRLDDHDDIFYHGFHVGLEFGW